MLSFFNSVTPTAIFRYDHTGAVIKPKSSGLSSHSFCPRRKNARGCYVCHRIISIDKTKSLVVLIDRKSAFWVDFKITILNLSTSSHLGVCSRQCFIKRRGERLSILSFYREAFFLATDPCFLLEFFDILGNILLEHYIINIWEDIGRWRAFHANTFGSRNSQYHIVELLDGEVGVAPQKGNNWAKHDMIPSVILDCFRSKFGYVLAVKTYFSDY